MVGHVQLRLSAISRYTRLSGVGVNHDVQDEPDRRARLSRTTSKASPTARGSWQVAIRLGHVHVRGRNRLMAFIPRVNQPVWFDGHPDKAALVLGVDEQSHLMWIRPIDGGAPFVVKYSDRWSDIPPHPAFPETVVRRHPRRRVERLRRSSRRARRSAGQLARTAARVPGQHRHRRVPVPVMQVATVTVPKGARVVDSASVLTSAQIRSLGAVATCRYYAPLVNGKRSWKALTPAEIVELHAAGSASSRTGNRPHHVRSAASPQASPTGASSPANSPSTASRSEVLVVMSCDMNATNTTSTVMGNRAAVESYFRAAFAQLTRVGYTRQGIYGDTDTFRWLADLDLVGWLMVSKSFSDGTLYGTHIAQQYQSGWNNPRSVPLAGIPNSVYDPNAVLRDVDGVWLPHDEPDQHPDVVPDQRPDVLPSASQEDDMPCIITCTTATRSSRRRLRHRRGPGDDGRPEAAGAGRRPRRMGRDRRHLRREEGRRQGARPRAQAPPTRTSSRSPARPSRTWHRGAAHLWTHYGRKR